MDTRRLAYYVTVVDCGTITRAAEILHLAQPALSQHVSALEHDLGHQLLIRSAKGVVPTAAGQSLYRYAQGILRLERSARDEIDSEATSPAGTVSIGVAGYSHATAMIVPTLPMIRARYPRIVVRLVETLTVIHSQALRMGLLDVALIYDPGPVRSVRFERVAVDELCLVAPRWLDIVGAAEETVPFDALAPLPFMLPSRGHTLRRLIETRFHQAGLEPEVSLEMDHTRPLAEAVRLGLGVTVMPRQAAEANFPADDFALRRIVDPYLSTTLALATAEDGARSAAADAVIEMLRETLVPATPEGAGEEPAA